MANLALAFNLSASAAGMARGINAGVIELQKLGYAAKQTSKDVSTLKTLELSRALISGVQTVASTLTRFASGAGEAIDQTRQLSESLGVAYDDLRTLQLAADLSGTSSQELASAFTRAQVTISKAAGGGKEATAALDRLGLSVDGLAKQTSTQQFASIAQAINSIENPATRAAAAVAIFGRSGAELLPAFRELPENIGEAKTFFEGFKNGLNALDRKNIDSVGDAFTKSARAIQETSGKIISALAPALTKGANEFIAFAQQLNIESAAKAVRGALGLVTGAVETLSRVLVPLADRALPAVSAYLVLINRQAIGAGISSLARTFTSAATAAGAFSVSAGLAATSMATLKAAARGLLVGTGVGLVAVAVGAAAEGLLSLATSTSDAEASMNGAVVNTAEQFKKLNREINASVTGANQFAAAAEVAFRVPAEVTDQTIIQGVIDDATQQFRQLAQEAGSIAAVPKEVAVAFATLQKRVASLSDEFTNAAFDEESIAQAARSVIVEVNRLTEARKLEAEASRQAAETARKTAEENRRRVEELASAGVTGAEQARLQLNKDLLAIGQEQQAAQQALGEAMRNNDAASIAAARERLQLAEQAVQAAKAQNRDRQLQALGIDQNLFKPAQTVASQFLKVREAFDKKLIDGGEAVTALRTLSAEGVQIRKDIADELRRPAQRALQVSDVRTSEGFSQFMSLTRPDPAIEQRREQLQKLNEIKQAIISTGARPVEILGAG